jgi:hypothetical protein
MGACSAATRIFLIGAAAILLQAGREVALCSGFLLLSISPGTTASSCRQQHAHLRLLAPPLRAAPVFDRDSSDALEFASSLASWVEGAGIDDEVQIKVINAVSVAGVLARYYESVANDMEQSGAFLVAASCSLGADDASRLSSTLAADTGSSFENMYHPDTHGSPSLCLLHGPAKRDDSLKWSPLPLGSPAPESSAVMDHFFVWMQQKMLAFDDDTEDSFLELGRKLLTVSRHVVTQACTDDGMVAVFWAQAAALSGSSRSEEEVSTLICAPSMASHPSFEDFFRTRLLEPLHELSPLGSSGKSLSADCYMVEGIGSGLQFPVLLLRPRSLQPIQEPEGGYKIYTSETGEVNADDYIRKIEEEAQQQKGNNRSAY